MSVDARWHSVLGEASPSCVNQSFPAPLSEAAWVHGMHEYSGIQAQLEDTGRHTATDTPQTVKTHQAVVKPYPRGASKTSVMIELMFNSDLSKSRNLAH